MLSSSLFCGLLCRTPRRRSNGGRSPKNSATIDGNDLFSKVDTFNDSPVPLSASPTMISQPGTGLTKESSWYCPYCCHAIMTTTSTQVGQPGSSSCNASLSTSASRQWTQDKPTSGQMIDSGIGFERSCSGLSRDPPSTTSSLPPLIEPSPLPLPLRHRPDKSGLNDSCLDLYDLISSHDPPPSPAPSPTWIATDDDDAAIELEPYNTTLLFGHYEQAGSRSETSLLGHRAVSRSDLTSSVTFPPNNHLLLSRMIERTLSFDKVMQDIAGSPLDACSNKCLTTQQMVEKLMYKLEILAQAKRLIIEQMNMLSDEVQKISCNANSSSVTNMSTLRLLNESSYGPMSRVQSQIF